jgi:hypothetical protein
MRNQPTVLLVGGDIRPHQLTRLRQSLNNVVVDWIATRATDPGPSRYESRILRPETILVVILDGLVRHRHSSDLLRLCRLHGKRYVRLYRSANVQRILQTLTTI